MKIAVLIPSDDYRNNAGVRIRYDRIIPHLAALGCEMALNDINGFDPLSAECDAMIISKCHDARALMCATVLSQRGSAVGVDLFDDYFSQIADSRMGRFRSWLTQLGPLLDFAVCSTSAMAEVAGSYQAKLPVHVMNDPAELPPRDELAAVLRRKQIETEQNQLVVLCWFGMGDNPHFRVGISDLAAFGAQLAAPVEQGFGVRLTVLTNARALDARGLALLRSLPVEVRIEEWSELREAELLGCSAAAFLPINAQSFSAAKSLNRAVTAMAAGCQVISSGYPLYALLDKLIYPSMAAFAADLGEGRQLIGEASLDQLYSLMDSYASPRNEAEKLVHFMAGRLQDKAAQASNGSHSRFAIIHGSATSGAVHKFGQRLGALAIRSPYCTANLGYDVMFGGKEAGCKPDMFISERALGRMLPRARDLARPFRKIGNQTFWTLARYGETPSEQDWAAVPLTMQLATYGAAMRDMQRQIGECFGPLQLMISEASPHPFAVPDLMAGIAA